MLLRSLTIGLVSWVIFASPGRGAPRTQRPAPYKIYVSLEDEREDQLQEAIRKLRTHEDRITEYVDDLKAHGVDWDDPELIILQRQLREIRRRIWRLERDRFN